MEIIPTDQLLYAITIEDLQEEALERIGRKLTEEEIDLAKDWLEDGLGWARDISYGVIFNEGIEK